MERLKRIMEHDELEGGCVGPMFCLSLGGGDAHMTTLGKATH